MLQVGQSYAFCVIDEIGDPHNLDSVAIKTIKMESVVMEPDVMVVTFNTEAGRSYQVISAESLTASDWTETVIHYPTDGGWGYGSGAFTATGTTITVKIPRNTQRRSSRSARWTEPISTTQWFATASPHGRPLRTAGGKRCRDSAHSAVCHRTPDLGARSAAASGIPRDAAFRADARHDGAPRDG